MGVDFFLYRRKRRKMPKSDIALPEIEARFAATEYPRFLSQLANDARIGEVWDSHQQALSTLSKALAKQVFADFDPERQSWPTKKERRQARKKQQRERREGKQEPETDHEIESLKQQVEETRKSIEELFGKDPIVEFLLAPMDSGEFDAEACQRIGPRIRMIAENWPDLRHGWRGRAFEIADAMEVAANHSDIVFGISG